MPYLIPCIDLLSSVYSILHPLCQNLVKPDAYLEYSGKLPGIFRKILLIRLMI